MADEANLSRDHRIQRTRSSAYPEPFASRRRGREKRALGDLCGLTIFRVNLTRLAPRAMSALRHAHSRQDEFDYTRHGSPTLYIDDGATRLVPGMCACMCARFKAGTGNGHHLANETYEEVVYLGIGDQTPGDEGSYPGDDLGAQRRDGKWIFVTRTDSRTDASPGSRRTLAGPRSRRFGHVVMLLDYAMIRRCPAIVSAPPFIPFAHRHDAPSAYRQAGQ